MRMVWAVALCFSATGAFGDAVTTGSLIDDMVNLERLTRYPSPAYKTIQFSSYDRKSVRPGEEAWFSNSDGSGVEAVIKEATDTTPGEYVLAEVDGPGAIVRVWTAEISGTIRVYLDGTATPVYDGPAVDFLQRPYNAFLGGGLSPEVLDGTFYQAQAAYAPIPFSKHCKIVWIGNQKDVHFYHIQFRMYDAGTAVTPFTPGDVAANAERIQKAAAILGDPAKNWAYRAGGAEKPVDANMPAGETREGVTFDGGGAIERLTIKVAANDLDLALRQTVLRIQFDGHPWGQVEAPVGDFFGAGPGIVPFDSLPFTVTADGTMTCRYVMPFAKSMRLTFENRGAQDVRVTGSALRADYAWDDKTSMHFRARWRADHGLTSSNKASLGVQDMTFLMAQGEGVYVGTSISILNPNSIPTPWGNWWGEGDEKIFVDGESFPSTFGTGSEDYFNYSWSSPNLFGHAYCGQPRDDGPANRGFVVNQRWHVLDPLPFRENLAFYMELASHERTEGVSYARLGYLYGRPGMVDDHRQLIAEDLQIPALPATWEPASRFGSNGWVFTACEDLLAKKGRAEFVDGPLWQGGRVMVWKPAKNGATLELEFEIAEAGEYVVTLTSMYAPGAGAFSADVDGAKVVLEGKDELNLDVEHGVRSRLVGTAPMKLVTGRHTLKLTAVSADKPIGLDFFGLIHRKK